VAEMECSECGTDLFDGQKFCAGCGIEMEWPEVPTAQVSEIIFADTMPLSKNENLMVKVLTLVFGAVAIIIVVFVYNFLSGSFSGFNNGNQQEACFNREMLKVGVYADPKGWAVQSRLYCKSLYP